MLGKMEKKCISCGKSLVNDPSSTTFMCPGCGKQEISRCSHCRELAAKYQCPECGFEGPN